MCAVDDFTEMYWLRFVKRKNEMVKFVSNLRSILKDEVIKVEYLRYENAGENITKLITLCSK